MIFVNAWFKLTLLMSECHLLFTGLYFRIQPLRGWIILYDPDLRFATAAINIQAFQACK